MTKIKLILSIVFLILFIVSVACNIVMFVLLRNSNQKIELEKLQIENERLKKEIELKEVYIEKIKAIKKERNDVIGGITEAATDAEILNIIGDIVNYNNSIVPDYSGSEAGEAETGGD